MKQIRPTRRLIRGNPFLREKVHDPYRAHEKLHDATSCPACGARFRNGRWTWPATDSRDFRQELCPACRRIEDHYPAGELVLSGGFLHQHVDEVLATVKHIAEQERGLHPLHRIMAIDEADGSITIATTDVHLPHRIAHALRSAFGGSMRTHYDLEGYFTRAHWERDG